MAEDRLRLTAYVLAADPSWIEESVLSYYDHVDRIVVSYDETGTSWTGTPIAVEECLARLKSIDVDGKLDYAPGSYYVPGRAPLDSDTAQRNDALARASIGADWVVQLDTDEVLADPDELVRAIEAADAGGFDGVEYPARLLYQHLRGSLYLELCRRTWAVAADYPGPVAVRAGTPLVHCRQADVALYRVDFKPRNTDPSHPKDAPVHRVVRPDQALIHFSWVRSDAHMDAKSRSSGHAHDFPWGPVIARWRDSREHPLRAVLGTPVRRGPQRKLLRFARVPGAPDRAARARNGLPG
ncbi:hypothetical protein [Mumia sp. DW29H23]|uniref:hypothetical protein n=1 Tax=Mumia sp. DW29H23 TaxID=3421241 RepID=UPI003D69AA7D